MKTIHTTRRAAGVVAALLAIGGFTITPVTPAFAHEAPCPFCGQAITQDTKEQDNEVVLKSGRKRIEYKCVYCALAEAHSDYKGDVTILAPSEKKGEPIRIERKEGKWAASTEGIRFIAQKGSHKVCQMLYRAFKTEDAAKAYVAKHKEHSVDAKTLTLEQMLQLVVEHNKESGHADHK